MDANEFKMLLDHYRTVLETYGERKAREMDTTGILHFAYTDNIAQNNLKNFVCLYLEYKKYGLT